MHSAQLHAWQSSTHDSLFDMRCRQLVSVSCRMKAPRIVWRIQLSCALIFWKMSLSVSDFPRAYQVAVAGFPSRPALPNSCQKVSMDEVGPQWITALMSGISIPMPKAMVQIKTRITESGLQNSFRVYCSRSADTCAWNMDIILWVPSQLSSQ